MKRLAIINQRYGLEVNGGSELYTREIAERLVKRYQVEVLTSCAIDYTTWENRYEAGTEQINGVTVRRFLVQHERDYEAFQQIHNQMEADTDANQELSDVWIDAMGPYCPELVAYVDKHQDEYDVVIVVTYLYYPAVRCMQRLKGRVLFIPTAHQEPMIHFKMYDEIFHRANAFVYLTEEEKELVQQQFHTEDIPYEVMGAGVDVPESVNDWRFKVKHHLEEYFIYVGRIDVGKNCPALFQDFMEYKRRTHNQVKLVLLGKQNCEIPEHEDIISMGFVSERDKFDGIKGAKALILPSRYESLSISVLEAMALGKPVIVNGDCDVLKGHCRKSDGGLYYHNSDEFMGCLNYIVNHPVESFVMGKNAKKYVDTYYRWNDIMRRFDRIIEEAGK